MDEFNAEGLLQKVKAQIMKDAPDVTEEKAEEAARNFIKCVVKAGSDGGGCIIGIGDEVITTGGGEMPAEPLPQTAPPEEKTKISPETREKCGKVLAKVDEKIPPVETVRLRVSRDRTTVFDSKMGGVPYFPKGMEYPTVREGVHAGKPLYFLAQLNFAKLPKIEGFPTEGILQFFAGFDYDEDYTIGMNYDNRCDQNGFRVIYHENVVSDGLFGADDMPEFEELDPYFPVKGELLLTADEPEKVSVTSSDIRFEGAFVASYNEVCKTSLESLWGSGGLYDADADFCNAVFEACNLQGTRIGGFPSFVQGDPRGDFPDHSILLFQSDSEWDGADYCVSWGDVGVANFFVTPEDLAKRNFSNVLYNWDCG